MPPDGSLGDARLAQLQGAVVEKEFDLVLLRANVVDTAALRVKLYAEADAIDTVPFRPRLFSLSSNA